MARFKVGDHVKLKEYDGFGLSSYKYGIVTDVKNTRRIGVDEERCKVKWKDDTFSSVSSVVLDKHIPPFKGDAFTTDSMRPELHFDYISKPPFKAGDIVSSVMQGVCVVQRCDINFVVYRNNESYEIMTHIGDTNVLNLLYHSETKQYTDFARKYYHSFSHILGLLTTDKYPDGTIIKSLNNEYLIEIKYDYSGENFTLIDSKNKCELSVTSDILNILYLLPQSKPEKKKITRNEILEKFNCEDFEIVGG